MYEIWSMGHKPFENITNDEVSVHSTLTYTHAYMYRYSSCWTQDTVSLLPLGVLVQSMLSWCRAGN